METLRERMVMSTGQKVMVHYIFKEKDRRTIAIAMNTSNLVSAHVVEIMDQYFPATLFTNKVKERLDMKNTYRSVAKCCPEDTWNKEEGMNIARTKLRAKLEDAMQKRKAYIAELLRHSVVDKL